MASTTIAAPARKNAQKLGLPGQMMAFAWSEVTPRFMLRALFAGVLISVTALEAIRFGVVERPIPLAATYTSVDPVVASVGREVLRVSDAYAHAAFIGEDDAAAMPELIASGTVDDAIDHLALAQAAREDGIDENLEIRALVALAERQILAEAYLDRIATLAADEEAIKARYAEERAALRREQLLQMAQIVVPTRAEAEAVIADLSGTSFARLAEERSIDEATKAQGGKMAQVRTGDLDERLQAALASLSIGTVSEPVETDQGWHVVRVESRRAMRLEPFEARRDAIAETLRREAIANALDSARDRMPVKLRSADAIAADEAASSEARIGLVRQL